MPKGSGYGRANYEGTSRQAKGENPNYNPGRGGAGTKNPHYEQVSTSPNKTVRNYSGGHIHGEKGVPSGGTHNVKTSGSGYGGTPKSHTTGSTFSG